MVTNGWMPPRQITRNGEIFIYNGDLANSKKMRENSIAFSHENGRKAAYVVDKNDKRALCHYISKKFYPSLCNTIHPSWGKGSL